MADGRWRRRARPQTLLPLHAGSAPNAVSCWYCDFKIYAFNGALFSLGRRYSRFLKIWFTMGAAFSFVILVGVSVMLLWDFIDAFNLPHGTSGVNGILGSWLFGTFSLLPGLSISIMDVGSIIVSTLLSVGLHEFGHAIAATSEGVHIEYIAVFLAILVPGALVAFNLQYLQSLPHSAVLRIYGAGIWHNVTFCAACLMTLISLPIILHPFFLHGEGAFVLGVPKASPFYGYLSPYDVIVAIDGLKIKNPHEWISLMSEVDSQMLTEPFEIKDTKKFQVLNHRKGYCVPNTWIEGSSNFDSCHNELTAFVRMPCFNSSLIFLSGEKNKSEDRYCLIAREVVKLKKCWNGWKLNGTNEPSCACSVDETCMTPVQIPGMSWVEVTYSSLYSPDCLEYKRHSSMYSEKFDFGSTSCEGTFVYIGNTLSAAHSVHLSAYQPQWASTILIAHLPNMLEKILSHCFHMSASLALVNSLPVYFLDGESVLETILCYFTFLSGRRRRKILHFCLVGGTILSFISFSRVVYFVLVVH
ncbi:membrane-bound transcription factor [Canna indica]|uniref:Endopeptidase S2P n=1 Tax=Canna indica TaxID=4628 RepID=A0AAQ3Q4S2_9LILI|nr:membrane-bound transcription factor [Canna indica]